MKKSIPIIRERESEAFILGNGREREFPLTPGVFCYVESFGVLLKSELDNHSKNLDLSKGRLHPCYGGTVVPALGDSQVGWQPL